MYSFSSVVRYSEVDEQGVLTVPALVNYLQDCSLFQAESLGVGVAHSAEAHRRWLLAAWEIELLRMPRFCDHVVVSTWATGFRGLFAGRNFTLRLGGEGERPGDGGRLDDGGRPDGELLVRADSLWFMYDDALGRPVRAPQEEIDPYLPDLERDERLAMPPIQRRLPVEGEGIPCAPIPVTTAHIDTNHHVNNAQYVALALGVLPESAVGRVRRLEVQYCEAAHLGDVIHPHVRPAEGGHVVTLDDARGTRYAVVRVCA